jgi:mannonate dehydratase
MLDGGELSDRAFANSRFGRDRSDGRHIPWSKESIARNVELFAENGFKVIAIEDTPPMEKVRLGLPGRDEEIENMLIQIRAMGELNIPLLSYNWMAVTNWTRTKLDAGSRGGALVTGFDMEEANTLPPLIEEGQYTSAQLWDALKYFLSAVIPTAEEYGVRLSMHPDDPPVPSLRNVPRIMSSHDAFRRMLALYPSPSNVVTFCQGNFTLMTENLPALIREIGATKSIGYVHFRDVSGTASCFIESFPDDGSTNLPECMKAYRDIDFDGPMRPDHVPTMDGELNDSPSYGTLGRLFAFGYIRGLQQCVYGK